MKQSNLRTGMTPDLGVLLRHWRDVRGRSQLDLSLDTGISQRQISFIESGRIADIEKIVTTIFDEISEALARGDRVELRGFGAFSVKKRDARVGRNPRTGDSVHVTQKFIPFFKTGKQLRERLNTE